MVARWAPVASTSCSEGQTWKVETKVFDFVVVYFYPLCTGSLCRVVDCLHLVSMSILNSVVYGIIRLCPHCHLVANWWNCSHWSCWFWPVCSHETWLTFGKITQNKSVKVREWKFSLSLPTGSVWFHTKPMFLREVILSLHVGHIARRVKTLCLRWISQTWTNGVTSFFFPWHTWCSLTGLQPSGSFWQHVAKLHPLTFYGVICT